MLRRTLTTTVLLAICLGVRAFAQQETHPREDTRTQYPALLANSYVSVNVGWVDDPLSSLQLQPGFRAGSVDVPHLAVRVVLVGHEFNKYLSAQGSYMRPVKYVSYRNVNGAAGTDHHYVRVDFGAVTLKTQAPIGRRLSAYGEGGVGFTSRTGFKINGAPGVSDEHFASALIGGGVDYHVSPTWDLTAGVTYSPGKASINQPRSVFSSGGFRYTMRPLPADVVDANRGAGFIFPEHVIHLEYSTGTGYAINRFVSETVPIFWGGNVAIDRGLAAHYEQNVFHTRKIFALDAGASAGGYQSRDDKDRFYTLSLYPLFRFTILRLAPADLYFAYSLAGPTYISKTILDGQDTGHRFTFQDFMGFGVFAGKNRNLNVGVKINHYSNGNIFTQNAGVKIPLTFSLGYAF